MHSRDICTLPGVLLRRLIIPSTQRFVADDSKGESGCIAGMIVIGECEHGFGGAVVAGHLDRTKAGIE